MNKKEKNAKEVAYLRKISEEAKKVNKKLEEDLRKIIKIGGFYGLCTANAGLKRRP